MAPARNDAEDVAADLQPDFRGSVASVSRREIQATFPEIPTSRFRRQSDSLIAHNPSSAVKDVIIDAPAERSRNLPPRFDGLFVPRSLLSEFCVDSQEILVEKGSSESLGRGSSNVVETGSKEDESFSRDEYALPNEKGLMAFQDINNSFSSTPMLDFPVWGEQVFSSIPILELPAAASNQPYGEEIESQQDVRSKEVLEETMDEMLSSSYADIFIPKEIRRELIEKAKFGESQKVTSNARVGLQSSRQSRKRKLPENSRFDYLEERRQHNRIKEEERRSARQAAADELREMTVKDELPRSVLTKLLAKHGLVWKDRHDVLRRANHQAGFHPRFTAAEIQNAKNVYLSVPNLGHSEFKVMTGLEKSLIERKLRQSGEAPERK